MSYDCAYDDHAWCQANPEVKTVLDCDCPCHGFSDYPFRDEPV